jgi:hypothetical protein
MNNLLVKIEHEDGQQATQLVKTPLSAEQKREDLIKEFTDADGTKRYKNITVIAADEANLPRLHHQ